MTLRANADGSLNARDTGQLEGCDEDCCDESPPDDNCCAFDNPDDPGDDELPPYPATLDLSATWSGTCSMHDVVETLNQVAPNANSWTVNLNPADCCIGAMVYCQDGNYYLLLTFQGMSDPVGGPPAVGAFPYPGGSAGSGGYIVQLTTISCEPLHLTGTTGTFAMIAEPGGAGRPDCECEGALTIEVTE